MICYQPLIQLVFHNVFWILWKYLGSRVCHAKLPHIDMTPLSMDTLESAILAYSSSSQEKKVVDRDDEGQSSRILQKEGLLKLIEDADEIASQSSHSSSPSSRPIDGGDEYETDLVIPLKCDGDEKKTKEEFDGEKSLDFDGLEEDGVDGSISASAEEDLRNESTDLVSPLGTMRRKINKSSLSKLKMDDDMLSAMLSPRQPVRVSLRKNQRKTLTEILSSPESAAKAFDDSIGSLSHSTELVEPGSGVRFSDEMDVNQYSKLGNSILNEIFYDSSEIAEFRYEKHMEDCGLDPNDFD